MARLESPVERDGYAELLAKHNEIVKRGDIPDSVPLIRRSGSESDSVDDGSDSSDSDESGADTDTGAEFAEEGVSSSSASGLNDATGILFGSPPTVSPAVALDEDGQDISKNHCHQI
jgi:hypothetical protein